jgi:hypothetical protein
LVAIVFVTIAIAAGRATVTGAAIDGTGSRQSSVGSGSTGEATATAAVAATVRRNLHE